METRIPLVSGVRRAPNHRHSKKNWAGLQNPAFSFIWISMGKVCLFDGCKNEHRAKGLCAAHYMRLKKHGDPGIVTRKPPGTATKEDRKISKAKSYEKKKEPYRDRRREQDRKRYAQKKEEIVRSKSIWRKNNPHIVQAQTAKRRSSRINATPKWLTGVQFLEIKAFYLSASIETKVTGIKHHVDHIVPLRGKLVCGLHVPWNLRVVTASENLSKGNRH